MNLILQVLLVLVFSSVSQAGENPSKYDIKEALSSGSAKSSLDKNIKLYWSKQKAPAIKKKLGVIRVNKKVNAFNKSDKEVCHLVLLSAIKGLQQEAKGMGADAIIDIKSNYKNKIYESSKAFECGAGSLIAGVALVGTAVKLSGAKKKPIPKPVAE